MGRRRLLAVLAVLLAAAGAWSIWQIATSAPAGPSAPSGPHGLEVVGQHGVLWRGVVARPVATPYELLQAGGNLTVEVRSDASFGGGCHGVYVVSIAGERERGSGGWNYYVRRAGTDWVWEPEGAACFRLEPGDAVQWRWVDA